CGELAELLVARRGGIDPLRVRLDAPRDAGPPSAVTHLRFESRNTTRDECRSERATLGHRDDIDRKPGAVGDRLHPWLDAGASTGGHDAPRRDQVAGEIEVM